MAIKVRPRAAVSFLCISAVGLVYFVVSFSTYPTVQRTVATSFGRGGEVTNNDSSSEGQPPKRPSLSQPLFILALASLPRSGSSLMAEFLGTLEGSVMFFEPMWLRRNTECAYNGSCVVEYLHGIFNCSFGSDFDTWLRYKGLFLGFFNEEVRNCLKQRAGPKEECRKALDLRKMCEQAPVRAMKVIRTRLSYLEPLMKDSNINFKVIYLTRDPRGSLSSIRRFGWNRDPKSRCGEMEKDQLAYEVLSKVYPNKVMHLKHENFCLDPLGATEKLITFLYDDPKVPEELHEFLVKHMISFMAKGGMSTIKLSAVEYQEWRHEIPEDQLMEIEGEPTCVRTIRRMGHRIFGSIQRANDSLLSLFERPFTSGLHPEDVEP